MGALRGGAGYALQAGALLTVDASLVKRNYSLPSRRRQSRSRT